VKHFESGPHSTCPRCTLTLDRNVIEREAWNGIVSGSGREPVALTLVMPVKRSSAGATGAFLGQASDGNRYWIKVPQNPTGPRSLVPEQIVGRLGALLGAATCRVTTLAIPQGLDWEYRSGRRLEAGIAHACEHVPGALETHILDRPRDDDNPRRYTSFAALYDWAWGDDVQGLHALDDDARFFSHDHGRYLTRQG
jgi:hypothetical protein